MSQSAPPLHRSMNLTEWALLIGLSVLWGGSFFFNGITVKELPPLVIVTCRVALAAVTLNMLLAIMGQRMPLTHATIPAFLGMGLLNNVIPFTLIVWGQGHIASGLAAILNATTPLFSVLTAHFLTTDEKMTGRRVIGVLCGVLGVAVMMGPSVIGGLGDDLLAQLAVLGAAVSYGLASVFGRRFRRMGRAAARDRLRAGQRVDGHSPADRAVRRSTLAPGYAEPHDDIGAGRTGVVFDRACLFDLFPHPGNRRRNQSVACHPASAGQRRHPRSDLSR